MTRRPLPNRLPALLLGALLLALAAPAEARAQQTVDQPRLSLEGAKRIVQGAEAEARANGWEVVIVIADPSGEPILLHRMDGVQLGSIDIALRKAWTAARFRRPTRELDEALAGGRMALLGVPGILPLEGGVPVLSGGRVIGAVGVSGVASADDARIAEAGIRRLQP